MTDPLAAIKFHLSQIDGSVQADFVLLKWDMDAPLGPPAGVVQWDAVSFQGDLWPIVVFDSELEARRFLCQQRDTYVVFVVCPPWTERDKLPADFRARSHERHVRPVSVRDALGAETGLLWCEAVQRPHLRRLCEHHFSDLAAKCVPSPQKDVLHLPQVEEAEVVRQIVDAALGFRLDQASPALALARAYRNLKRKGHPLKDDLAPILAGRARECYPAHADVLTWALSDRAHVETLLVEGARLEAESAITSSPAIGSLGKLRADRMVRATDKDAAGKHFVAEVRALAMAALRELGPDGRKLIRDHEGEIGQPLGDGDYTPVLSRCLTHALGREMEECLAGRPTSDARIAEQSEHLFAAEATDDLAAVGCAAKLARCLACMPTDTAPVGLATWYSVDGCFADHAAKRLSITVRGNVTAAVARAGAALLSAYWEARDLLNERFALGITQDYSHVIFSTDLVGVQRVHKTIVEPRLLAGERVLLVCIDGCSAPDLVGLVDDLVAEGFGLDGPTWRSGLSLLPSVTEVSRLALLAGGIPSDPMKLGQEDAPQAGDQQHKAFTKALGKRTGQLFLKGDLHQGFHALREAIYDEATDVVAVVLNTIDDHIRTPEVAPRLYGAADITHLTNAVREGCAAGRAVIITSDHGHTLHRSTALRRADAEGIKERIVGLMEGEPPPPGVVRLTLKELVPYIGIDTIGLLYRSGEYACVQPATGYHGGASLEECVVPVTTIVAGGSAPAKPAWWTSERSVATTPEPARTGAEEETPTDRLVVVVGGERRALRMPAGLSERGVQALQLLSQQSDRRLTTAQLAQQLGMRPGRVDPTMAELIGKLQANGLDWVASAPSTGGTEYEFRGGGGL